MNNSGARPGPPLLAHAYIKHVRPHTRGKPAEWGPAWVAGAQLFGRQLIWLGAVVIALSWFPPELSWRLMLGFMGLTTAAVGAWHRIHAETLCQLGLAGVRDPVST